jgi:AraC-like DNA-binding protein
MKRLNDFDGLDPVSKLLRSVRVRSTIYCRSQMRAPWGFAVEAHDNPAFHLVTSGRCQLEVEGHADHVELAAGDLVVLPNGRRHALRDSPQSPVTYLDEILASTPPRGGRLYWGGDGAPSGLLCGGFALEGGTSRPLLKALPPILEVRGARGRPVPWLGATVQMLSAETASGAPGSEEVVARLADTLLTQALRFALVQLQSEDEASLPALRDPQISAAIALIHGQPDHEWTVGELAAEVALSRSTFAARFRDVVGESPMRYLTRTRLAHAAALLRTTDASLAVIAVQAGYRTEFSFSKAFKREFGIAPGAFRGRVGERPELELAGRG